MAQAGPKTHPLENGDDIGAQKGFLFLFAYCDWRFVAPVVPHDRSRREPERGDSVLNSISSFDHRSVKVFLYFQWYRKRPPFRAPSIVSLVAS